MAAKFLLMLFAVAMAIAVTTALTFEDMEDGDLDAILDLMSKRGGTGEFEGGEDDLFMPEMAKRGRYVRCTNLINGLTCICDRRYGRNNPKRYSVCESPRAGQ